MNVGVIGGGDWGRALATLAAEAGHRAQIGYRSRPPGGLPGTPNLAGLVRESELVLLAVPPQSIREVIRTAAPSASARIVIACRGIEPHTGGWLTEVIPTESACLRVGVLTGPALAAEVVQRRPCALLVASAYDEVCTLTQRALHSSICRVYSTRDLRGSELAGAMVNVMAVALGMADALKLGVGVRGVIVTRGLAEAMRLGETLGAQQRTFAGLAGVGDIVACGSHPSHPGYQAGRVLARGGTDPAVQQQTGALLALARRQKVDLPITEALYAISAGKLKARLAIDHLMRREATGE